MLIFILGTLLGILSGSLLCAAYLRQEIAAGVNPKLKRVQLQLDTIESQLNLMRAELYASLPAVVSRQAPDRGTY